MNWAVFWKVAIGTPVGLALLLALIGCGIWMEERIGRVPAMVIIFGALILGLATAFGFASGGAA